NRTL
ncbi:hypothetical protein D046_5761B, partial [Vibrio parahaemolyticus V-223/04]